ncbi:unnamed protein product, partial [Closterium sp. Naga37s-1]
MIAAGPHGKLDEYLPVVDLLLNVRKVLAEVGEKESGRRADMLLRTAMEDLDYELRDILKRRSKQASARFSVDELKRLFQAEFLHAGGGVELAQEGGEVRPGGGSKGADGRVEAGGCAELSPGVFTCKHSPPLCPCCPHRSVRVEAVKALMDELRLEDVSVRVEAVKALMDELRLEDVLSPGVIHEAPWRVLEQASKEWVQAAYIIGALIIPMEHQTVNEAWKGMDTQRRAALRGVLEDGGVGRRVLFLADVLRAIVSRRMAEQLFSLLDAYQVVQEIMPELAATFQDLKVSNVWGACEGLPLLLGRAVAACFQRLKLLLEDSAASNLADAMRKPVPAKKAALSFLTRSATSNSSTAVAPDESVYEIVPRGGAVDSITSYVANYIRSYMQRQGRRSYVDSLTSLFSLLEAHPDEDPSSLTADFALLSLPASSSLSPLASSNPIAAAAAAATMNATSASAMSANGRAPGVGRSLESETAQLVMALRRNLESRARLYPEEELQQLFLMNNLNYLVKSMNDWHGWHSQGIEKNLSAVRREGAKDLMVALADLHDDRVVQQHAGAFQSLALLKVMTALSTNEDAVQPSHRSAADYVKAEMQRLKRFNLAFEELQERQRHWTIPDDGLRRKIRAKWATSIKERYRKMLLPY